MFLCCPRSKNRKTTKGHFLSEEDGPLKYLKTVLKILLFFFKKNLYHKIRFVPTDKCGVMPLSVTRHDKFDHGTFTGACENSI